MIYAPAPSKPVKNNDVLTLYMARNSNKRHISEEDIFQRCISLETPRNIFVCLKLSHLFDDSFCLTLFTEEFTPRFKLFFFTESSLSEISTPPFDMSLLAEKWRRIRFRLYQHKAKTRTRFFRNVELSEK